MGLEGATRGFLFDLIPGLGCGDTNALSPAIIRLTEQNASVNCTRRIQRLDEPWVRKTQNGKQKKGPQPVGCSPFSDFQSLHQSPGGGVSQNSGNRRRNRNYVLFWTFLHRRFSKTTPKGRPMSKACSYPKAVHVNSYTRRRNGRFETVCEHCRSYPK